MKKLLCLTILSTVASFAQQPKPAYFTARYPYTQAVKLNHEYKDQLAKRTAALKNLDVKLGQGNDVKVIRALDEFYDLVSQLSLTRAGMSDYCRIVKKQLEEEYLGRKLSEQEYDEGMALVKSMESYVGAGGNLTAKEKITIDRAMDVHNKKFPSLADK